MRANFEQKNRFVGRTGADLSDNSLDGVTGRQPNLQAVWRATIAVRVHDILAVPQTNDIRSVYGLFYLMDCLPFTDIRAYIGVGSMEVFLYLCDRIALVLRNLLDGEAIAGRGGYVLGHASRIEGLLLGVFGQIVLIQRPCELCTLTSYCCHCSVHPIR